MNNNKIALFIEDNYDHFILFSNIMIKVGFNVYPEKEMIADQEALYEFLHNNTNEYDVLKGNIFKYIIDQQLYDKISIIVLDLRLCGTDENGEQDKSGEKLLSDFTKEFYSFFNKINFIEANKYKTWHKYIPVIVLTDFDETECSRFIAQFQHSHPIVAIRKKYVIGCNDYLISTINNILLQIGIHKDDDMIKTIDLKHEKQKICRTMICQFKTSDFDWNIIEGLHFIENNKKLENKLMNYLSIAKQNSINLLIFPELSIPQNQIEILQKWSINQRIVIIAGSHYYKNENTYIQRCPIIISGEVYFSEKITLSPLEKSPIKLEGVHPGNLIIKFINSFIGNFSTLICADYLNDEIKRQLDINSLDILCIPAWQGDSEMYYRRMNTDCENSTNGIYINYVNFFDGKNCDGNSALFGIMDKLYCEKLKNLGYTDLKPNKKIIQLTELDEYAIYDLHLYCKRPFVNRNIDTYPNIEIISKSNFPDSRDIDSKKQTPNSEYLNKQYMTMSDLKNDNNNSTEIHIDTGGGDFVMGTQYKTKGNDSPIIIGNNNITFSEIKFENELKKYSVTKDDINDLFQILNTEREQSNTNVLISKIKIWWGKITKYVRDLSVEVFGQLLVSLNLLSFEKVNLVINAIQNL